MTDLLAARSQMAMSLGFHILFAVAGMAMPLLMVIAERLGQVRNDPVWTELARRQAKGTAILFAVGAVSGTVLSFELGMLWPGFMEHAGPVFGMPFSLEGLAFFLEAIFLGLYLYGWDRLSPRVHLATGVGVLLCGTASGVLVVAANGWMNTPTGFTIAPDGTFTDIDVWAAMFNAAWPTQALHMTLAAFASVGFGVAGVHAWILLRSRDSTGIHRRALAVALAVGGVAAFLQPLSGDLSAKHVAEHQPVKLAAMEGHFHTQAAAPLRVGGWPDEETMQTPYSIELPGLLSFLAFADFDATVRGLEEFPRDHWPPVLIVHIAFQVMVGAGVAMMGVAALSAVLAWRRRRRGLPALPTRRWFLWLVFLSGPLGFIALEAGWTVTEVGRQPWIIAGVMRTADAVTPMPGLVVPFATFTLLYIVLGVVSIVLLKRHVFFDAPTPATARAAEGDRAA